jgi:tetratricopeptide (TPR) repeat protein
LILAFAWTIHPAQAADNHVWQLYASGRYDEAIKAGEAQNNAAGLALAARAGLAAEMMRAQPCLDCLRHVEADARRAVALDPRLPDGHIYLAAALGYEARIQGLIVARLKAYPDQAKTHLDAALAADPENCWALAALGGWHVEIVHSGGETLAHWVYSASLDEGLSDFARAFACAPDNLVFRYQYALALGGYDAKHYRAEIEDALARAAAMKPATAYESFAQVRARELLSALRAKEMKAFAKLVRRDQGYP